MVSQADDTDLENGYQLVSGYQKGAAGQHMIIFEGCGSWTPVMLDYSKYLM